MVADTSTHRSLRWGPVLLARARPPPRVVIKSPFSPSPFHHQPINFRPRLALLSWVIARTSIVRICTMVHCIMCGDDKAGDDFSNKQLDKKGDVARACLGCLDLTPREFENRRFGRAVVNSAGAHGWDVNRIRGDYTFNDGARLAFERFDGDGHRQLLEWWPSTGTVATKLNHPRAGKSQRFRKSTADAAVTMLKLLLKNPREHTDVAYERVEQQRGREYGGGGAGGRGRSQSRSGGAGGRRSYSRSRSPLERTRRSGSVSFWRVGVRTSERREGEVCNLYQQGECRWGPACSLEHSPAGIRQSVTSYSDMPSGEECRQFAKFGECPWGK